MNNQKAISSWFGANRRYQWMALLALLSLALPLSSPTPIPYLSIIPLICFSYALGPRHLLVSSLALIGASSVVGLEAALYCASSLLLVLVSMQLLKRASPLPFQTRLSFCAPLIDIIVRYCLYLLSPNQMPIMLPLVSALVTFFLTTMLVTSAQRFHLHRQKTITTAALLPLLVIGTFTLFAIPPSPYFDASIPVIVLVTLVLTKVAPPSLPLSYLLISSSLVLFNSGTQTLTLVLVFPLALTLMFKEQHKIVFAIAYLSLTYLIASYLEYPFTENYFFLMPLLATLVFTLIPSGTYSALAKRIAGSKEDLEESDIAYKQARQKVATKIAGYKEIFAKIGEEMGKDETSRQMQETLRDIYLSSCGSCPKANICYANHSPMLALLPRAIIKGLTSSDHSYLEENCLKPSKLFSRLDEKRRNYTIEQKFYREQARMQQLVAVELTQAAMFLEECRKEILSQEITPLARIAETAKSQIRELGRELTYLHIEKTAERTYVSGTIEGNETLVKSEIIPLFSRLLGVEMNIVQGSYNGLDCLYRFQLASVKSYNLVYGVSQVGRDFLTCGDTYRVFRGEIEQIIALSDGMGSGEEAARESQFTIQVLEKMLSGGLDTNQAIKNLNTLLKIKNRSDTYATLDVMSFNLQNGRARFVKSGAYPSYIIRHKKLRKIEVDSVPVGIVDAIEVAGEAIALQEGDMVVMMSDGVEESLGAALEETLLSIDEIDPQKYSGELLARCQEKEIKDDLTIVIAQVVTS